MAILFENSTFPPFCIICAMPQVIDGNDINTTRHIQFVNQVALVRHQPFFSATFEEKKHGHCQLGAAVVVAFF